MALYVSKATMAFDGEEETNFNKVTVNEKILHAQVPLMNKTGTSEKTARHGFSLSYVVPVVGARNWEDVKDATCRIDFVGGDGFLYSGVYISSIGEAEVSDDSDMVEQVITCIAESRVKV